jgi:hypothetical protein
MSADALNPTATGVSLITEKADQRMELMARVAAESVRGLFEKMMKCVCRYQNKAEHVELFKQWLTIDPREWVDGYHIHINVGLGTGSKDKLSAVMSHIFQMQGPLIQSGAILPQAAIMAARKFAEGAGITSPEQYFPDAQPPRQPGPPPQVMIKQMELQADSQKFQAEAQLTMQRESLQAQAKQRETQLQLELQAANDARDAERELMKAQYEAQLEAQRLELERYKTDADNRTRIDVALINQQGRTVQQGLPE